MGAVWARMLGCCKYHQIIELKQITTHLFHETFNRVLLQISSNNRTKANHNTIRHSIHLNGAVANIIK